MKNPETRQSGNVFAGDYKNRDSSWTDIIAAFPELHGMMIGHLDLPEIFSPSVNGNYHNRKNMALMRLLELHSNSLPVVLFHGEKVRSIIPCELFTSTWNYLGIIFSHPFKIDSAVIITSERILVALESIKCTSTAWLEVNRNRFFETLKKSGTKRKIQFNLSQGYCLSIERVNIPARLPSMSANKQYNNPEAYSSHPKQNRNGKIITPLCPKCFRKAEENTDICPHCRTQFYSPTSAMLKSMLMPGWFPMVGCRSSLARLRVFFTVCLLTSIVIFAILGKPLIVICCSLLAVTNHFSYGYHVYRLARLGLWTDET